MRALLMAIAYLILYYMQRTALSSGINTSVIVSIYSGQSFIASLLFYIFFKERLMIKHIVGMFLMVACILMISTAGKSNTQHESYLNPETRTSIVVPIFFAILGCIVQSFASLFIKLLSKRGFTSM